jgi:hypothetical protein
MAILPYMKQLPQDYYAKNYSAPPPSVVEETPPPVISFVPPDEPLTILEGGQSGVWYGSTPPDSPENGAMWLNSANSGLYVYEDPGVWVQVGTNW